MRYQFYKTKKKLNLFLAYEKNRLLLKNVYSNTNIPNYIRQVAGFKLFKQGVDSVRNRCLITNKSRSVFSNFKLSRIKLRWLISNNYINGVKKTNY